MDLETTSVEGYALLRLLGKGGMGEVWEARHRLRGTPAAVKLIDADLITSTQTQRRFAREARVLESVDSPNAVKILETGVADDGRPYLAMELLEGESLGKRLELAKTISLVECAEIVTPLARGLAAAHALGIVHRDLKPDNVFLCRDGVVKLLDFGIAKVLAESQDLSLSARTMAGGAIGTPAYMSPEQARGLPSIDHRSDLWSLGVLVFRALTGRDPFLGSWPGPLLLEICEAPLPLASVLVPGLPASIDSFFARALARDPDRRFQSAADLAERLAEIARADDSPTIMLPPAFDADETGTARLVTMRPTHTVRMKISTAAPPSSIPVPPPLTTGSSMPVVVPPSSSSMPVAKPARSGLVLGVAAGGVCVGIVLGLGLGVALRASRPSVGMVAPPNAVEANLPDGGRDR